MKLQEGTRGPKMGSKLFSSSFMVFTRMASKIVQNDPLGPPWHPPGALEGNRIPICRSSTRLSRQKEAKMSPKRSKNESKCELFFRHDFCFVLGTRNDQNCVQHFGLPVGDQNGAKTRRKRHRTQGSKKDGKTTLQGTIGRPAAADRVASSAPQTGL